METQLLEWLNLLLRWFHMIVGITWIGTSFFFVWLDTSLRKAPHLADGVRGESWMVHGGGFYNARKFMVAPKDMPPVLHWFTHDAYLTWVSGFLLLIVIYYFKASAFLIDPSVADLSPWQAIVLSLVMLAGGWVAYDQLCKSPIGRDTRSLAIAVFLLTAIASFIFCHVFSGRGAFIHIGAFLGTIMVANVAHVIIPNQRKITAALIEGREPEARLGEEGKQRSLHNNYLTLPVLFMMISNHYAMVFSHPLNWLIAVGIIIVGALVRHHMNQSTREERDPWQPAYLPAAGAAMIAVVLITAWRPDQASSVAATAAGEHVTLASVEPIIERHCVSCHASVPTHEGFDAPPGGVRLDSPTLIQTWAGPINQQAGLAQIMPLGNETGMTEDERAIIRAWAENGSATN
ncbi:MAG: urate hydroxylase PuuD [Pseudomonadota bacterium]